jgi:hypothetical protein
MSELEYTPSDAVRRVSMVERRLSMSPSGARPLRRPPLAQRTDGLLVISLQPNDEETSDLLAG